MGREFAGATRKTIAIAIFSAIHPGSTLPEWAIGNVPVVSRGALFRIDRRMQGYRERRSKKGSIPPSTSGTKETIYASEAGLYRQIIEEASSCERPRIDT